MRTPPTPRIVRVEACSVKDWEDEFANAHRATFFHSPLWSRIWQQYSHGQYRPAPIRVNFADGRSALLARTVRRTGYGVLRWHLSPAGTYGGWLARESLPDDCQRVLRGFVGKARSVIWFEQPQRTVLDDQQAELRTSHVIDLQDGVDAARAQWTSSARREVGRARRGDVRVREAQTFSDWAAYFASYVRTMNLWKSPTSSYDLSLFRLLWEARSPSVRLWLAEQKSLVIGGALVFTHGNSAVWWHAAQAPRVSGTANLLQWEILAVLDADGIGTYDLSSSGGHQGVVAFKESLGAAAVSFRYLVRRHPVERVMGFAKQSANRARSW